MKVKNIVMLMSCNKFNYSKGNLFELIGRNFKEVVDEYIKEDLSKLGNDIRDIEEFYDKEGKVFRESLIYNCYGEEYVEFWIREDDVLYNKVDGVEVENEDKDWMEVFENM